MKKKKHHWNSIFEKCKLYRKNVKCTEYKVLNLQNSVQNAKSGQIKKLSVSVALIYFHCRQMRR